MIATSFASTSLSPEGRGATSLSKPNPTGVGLGVGVGVGVGPATTVWGTPAEVEPPKLLSPEYVATSVFTPGVFDTSWQLPALAATVQLLVPSVIVTVPVRIVPAEPAVVIV